MGGSDNSDNGLRATPVQPNPPQLPPAPKAPWMEMLPTSLGEDWCSLLGDLGLVGISGRGTSEGGVAGAVTSEDAAPAKASDCDVVVGGQSFKAHRAVLAAAVPSLRPTLGMQARVDPGEDTSASVNAVSGAFDLNGNGGNDRVKLVVEDRVITTTALSGTTISTTSTNTTAATFSHVLLFIYSGDPQIPRTSTEEHIAAAGKFFLDKPLDEYLMADVEFKVQGRRFLAHRAFLTSRSAVFSTMLCGQFNNEGVVDIAECSAESFRCLLEYLYTDHTDIQSNDMCELLALGIRYEVPRLVALCELYLSMALAEQTKDTITKADVDVLDLLVWSQEMGAHQLTKFLKHFVCTNYQPLMQRYGEEGFATLGEELHAYVEANQVTREAERRCVPLSRNQFLS
mmetsp:Transcript_88278/g.252481  ORF Transcript_88278/g.252481 Transcript_88278/m.252481 type:complete len:399 (+) Transcript_88278:1424-2620(+)